MSNKEKSEGKIPTIRDYAIVSPEGKLNPSILEIMNVLELPHDGALESIVNITQEKFIQKKPDGQRKERWEIEEVLPHLKKEAMPILDKLGMLKEFFPSGEKYDSVLMFGALLPSVRKRLNYLIDLWENGVRFDKIVFLGGERPLIEEKESRDMLYDKKNKDMLVRGDWQVPEKKPTNELEMMQLVWNQARLPDDMRKISTEWINAPLKPNPTGGKPLRPTTEDTINIWLRNSPTERKILAISNNPHIGYQQSVLETYLPEDFKIETVGSAASLELSLAFYLGEMTRWLYQEQQRLGKK